MRNLYNDPLTNEKWEYSDEEVAAGLVRDGLAPMTEAEIELHINPPPSEASLLASARAERDRLLAYATLRIDPLQDAVDLDEVTDEDAANLKLWKQYRVAVNRVSTQAGYPAIIDWPPSPEDITTT